jgi:hypothetical protein
MPIVAIFSVSSTTGVGLPGSILGKGISSKLMNSIVRVVSFSIPYGCCGALRFLRDPLQAWLDAPSLGGAMVVKMVSTKLVPSITPANMLYALYTLSVFVFINFTINLPLPSCFPYIGIM